MAGVEPEYGEPVAVAGKIGLSLLIVLGALVLLYMSAYAFSVNRAVLAVGQWGLVLLALLGVGAVWRLPGPWLVPGLALAGLVAFLLGRASGLF